MPGSPLGEEVLALGPEAHPAAAVLEEEGSGGHGTPHLLPGRGRIAGSTVRTVRTVRRPATWLSGRGR
jgi:hypothetical protein